LKRRAQAEACGQKMILTCIARAATPKAVLPEEKNVPQGNTSVDFNAISLHLPTTSDYKMYKP
jgi:hypothetical protein